MPARRPISGRGIRRRPQVDDDDDDEEERQAGSEVDEEEDSDDETPKKRARVGQRAVPVPQKPKAGRPAAKSRNNRVTQTEYVEEEVKDEPGVEVGVGYDDEEDNEAMDMNGNNEEEEDDELQEEELVDGHELDNEDIDQGNPLLQKHAPGAIVRVKLLNFVTYTEVEFNPGPSLNMVIGPNGTGKSTLVCAICLGLGWGPNHLGRAKEVSEFVKHGCSDATTEIELQGRPGRRNVVITRKIFRENNSTKYWVNGEVATHKQVQSEVAKFSIQIDNLCQFLPQERVCEFAALDAVNLLKETQRAAAPPEVLENHKQLVLIGKEQKSRKIQFDENTANLAKEEARQRALEPDVQRIRERQNVLREIELHRKAKPYARYRISRAVAMKSKENFRKLQHEYKGLQEDQEPAMRKVEEKKAYKEKIGKLVREKQKEVDGVAKELQTFKRQILDDQEGKITEARAELSALWKKEKDRKLEETRMRNRINKLKEDYQNKPQEPDIAKFNAEITAKLNESSNLRRECEELESVMRPRVEQGRAKYDEVKRLEHSLQQLESQAGQREALLMRISRDTYAAWDWIQKNRDKFESDVYGPAMIECNVTNPRYTDIIEFIIKKGNLLAITCTSTKDYRTLTKAFFGNGGMGLGDVTINNYSETNAPTLQHQRQQMSTDELKEKYGMDGWALDFIEGPDAVLNMLCHEVKVHQRPITLKKVDRNQLRVLETDFPAYVAERTMYTTSWRKEYGPDAKSVMVSRITPAQILAVQQVDQAEKSRLSRKIAELKSEIADIQQDHNESKAKLEEMRSKVKSLNRDKDDLQAEKERQQHAIRKWKKLGDDIAQEEEKLAEKVAVNYRQEAEAQDRKLTNLTIERAKSALKFTALVNRLVDLQNEQIRFQLWDIEAASDVEILEFRNRTVVEKLKAKEDEVEKAYAESQRAKKEALKDQEDVIRSKQESPLTAEDNEYIEKINERNLTLDDLDNEIEAIKGRLALLHEGNPNAIRDFEERSKRIDNLQRAIKEQGKDLGKINKAMETIRSKWEPALDKVVKSISDAFSESFNKIGCAGEVRINKVEDFEKWEIQILVKFRESEKLQILTNQRQSGGERAVSTVFYLMALQSLAQAPFRVVDEINQGMDPRNERLVHHRMVGIACRKHTSQYFLITPKLLADLRYHPRMRVHTINSGDWVEEGYQIDVNAYIASLQKRNQGMAQ